MHNKKTMNQVCDIFLNQNSVELEEILEENWGEIWDLGSEMSRNWELRDGCVAEAPQRFVNKGLNTHVILGLGFRV